MESKTPNYSMIPGSREKDTPGNFRDTAPNNYMSAVNMGHETPANEGHSPMEKHEPGHGRQPGESKEDYGKRVYEEAMAKIKKQKEAAGNNKKSGRAGDFKIGPITGNLNRYGEGG
jgi:hypothetical protein